MRVTPEKKMEKRINPPKWGGKLNGVLGGRETTVESRVIREGRVEIEVTSGVFFNQWMKVSRDIGTVAVSLVGGSYLDAQAGTGIRGLRASVEAGLEVTLNDWSPLAYRLLQQNAARNHASVRVLNRDANALLHEERFDIVELDPFGSPAPFLDSASRSARKMLCITATDTAPLCGAHLRAGIRKYSSHPLKTEYHRETGVRVLLGAVIQSLARWDKAGIPLLSYAHRHHVRVYLEIQRGAKKADHTLENMGYLLHCPRCNWREPETQPCKTCPTCNIPLTPSGPLWIGRLHEKGFCRKILEKLKEKEAAKIVSRCLQEIDTPAYYDYHKLCKTLKISPYSTGRLIEILKEHGYQASTTHFSGYAFKTTANIEEIKKILENQL